MGRHASADGRRRIAAWPIVLVVVVLLLVGVTVAYVVIVTPDNRTAACTGSTVLPVTVSPGSSRAVTHAAIAFNATHPIARSTCVSVSVSTLRGAAAAGALAAGWKNAAPPAPALWIVDSAADVAAVDADHPAMTAGHQNTALATSPVVVAVRAAPPTSVSWKGLADGSVPLVITMPDPAINRASSYALESMVSASADTPGEAVAAAAVTGSTNLLRRLAAAAPDPPTTTEAALTELSAGSGGFTAVPVVESELAAYNASHNPALTALYPSGPTAGDEMMAVPLTSTWVTDAMSDAAAAFDAFLSGAKGTAILTNDHLRTVGTPAKAAGIDTRTKVVSLPDATVTVRTDLESAWETALNRAPPTGNGPAPATDPTSPVTSSPVTSTPGSATPPSTTPITATANPTSLPKVLPRKITKVTPTAAPAPGPAVTFVLDTSGSMGTIQGNLQRIRWMQSAVNADIQRSPKDLFGLWSFSTQSGSNGYSKLVPVGALTEQLNGTPRATTLTAAVNGLTPGGDSWTYGTIQAAYSDAVSTAVAGRPNRVIVVTDSLDTTPNLTRVTLLSAMGSLAAQHKNVVLDIVGLSTDVNSVAMTEIAQAGGGSFRSVTDLSGLQSTLLGLTA
jgi:hypothetical protein